MGGMWKLLTIEDLEFCKQSTLGLYCKMSDGVADGNEDSIRLVSGGAHL